MLSVLSYYVMIQKQGKFMSKLNTALGSGCPRNKEAAFLGVFRLIGQLNYIMYVQERCRARQEEGAAIAAGSGRSGSSSAAAVLGVSSHASHAVVGPRL